MMLIGRHLTNDMMSQVDEKQWFNSEEDGAYVAFLSLSIGMKLMCI